MFNALKWKDHFVSPNNSYKLTHNADGTVTLVPVGTVIQQGTKMSAENFNRMELGILDSDLANRLLSLAARAIGKAEDGFSPTVSIEETSTGHRVIITDAAGPHSFDVNNGEKGETGATGATGPAGAKGANATINGVTALSIVAGAGIKATQSGSTLTIAATYTYGTADIEAGSSSSSPEGTLHFVYE